MLDELGPGPGAAGTEDFFLQIPARFRAAGGRLVGSAGQGNQLVTQLGSDAKARAELGFRPRSLDAGLPDTVRSLLQGVFAAP